MGYPCQLVVDGSRGVSARELEAAPGHDAHKAQLIALIAGDIAGHSPEDTEPDDVTSMEVHVTVDTTPKAERRRSRHRRASGLMLEGTPGHDALKARLIDMISGEVWFLLDGSEGRLPVGAAPADVTRIEVRAWLDIMPEEDYGAPDWHESRRDCDMMD